MNMISILRQRVVFVPAAHRRTTAISALAVTLFSSVALALDPPPDGGYPNGNTAEGEDALFSLTTGDTSTAVGYQALYSQTWGGGNTAVGYGALRNTVYAGGNTAVGNYALYHSTTGSWNCAVGYSALTNNQSGEFNTATGNWTLVRNTVGIRNTATGSGSLQGNGSGDDNTATGTGALSANYVGNCNTATGVGALGLNLASDNSAHGKAALILNTTGTRNAAEGTEALRSNVDGNDNAAMGYGALYSSKGSRNIGLGSNAGCKLTTGSDNIDIGNSGVDTDDGVIRIGTTGTHHAAVIAGIENAMIARGRPVVISHAGRLGIATSSARYKEAIKPMANLSEVILFLQPVSFRYKKELDPEAIPQFGLVAEEVAKIDPDLIEKDEQGKPYTVRYEAVNAMLLNEFLKEHRHVQEQDAIIARQQEQIEALITGLHKVSAQLETIKSAPQTVANNY